MSPALARPESLRPSWPAAKDSWRPPRRVMVVEDDPVLQMDLVRLLQAGGQEVVATAGRGDAAVAHFAAACAAGKTPDLVLLDIHLGRGMDGIEAAHGIRALDAEVALIFRTGQTDPATRERAALIAPLAFLDKITPVEAVLRAVAAVPARGSEATR